MRNTCHLPAVSARPACTRLAGLLAVLYAFSTLGNPPGPAAAAAPASALLPLQAFKSRPSNGIQILGFPADFAVAVMPKPVRAAAAKAAPAAPAKPTVFALSKTQKVWLEVQPASPWTIEGVRAALAESEPRYAVEESVRQREQAFVREQQLLAQQAANAVRRNVWRERAARAPSGSGLAATLAQASGPIVITTTTVRSCPPQPASTTCPRIAAARQRAAAAAKCTPCPGRR